MDDFDVEASRQRAGLTADGRDDHLLIRCASLAASSHNTQPWIFRTGPDSITIRPDTARRCTVVDPDDAHLFRSLGCAAENRVQAAAAQGLEARVRFDPTDDSVIINLAASAPITSTDLFDAIGTRQCTRLAFDGTPVNPDDLAHLELAGTGAAADRWEVTSPE